MYAGIIAALKAAYRKRILYQIFDNTDASIKCM